MVFMQHSFDPRLPAVATASIVERALTGVAGLAGASGVALAAVAAHVTGGATLTTAALFLLLHAAATLGIVALVAQGTMSRLPLRVGGGLMLLGVLLFSGDLALRQLAGLKLLWGTAPAGGTIMILGWLAGAVATLRKP